jgi:pimeloyl-ACP methyl ester carboxylesterase
MERTQRVQLLSAMVAYLLLAASCGQGPTNKKSTEWTDQSTHKSGFVTANGIRLNYLDWGGSGSVLILIHGLNDNPHIFDNVAAAFTDRFRVIAYARRGHGDSEAKEPYDVATLTEDLRGLMDALGIAKADLAGWSMGGSEITAMAANHPERVQRIVYIEGGYDFSDPAVGAALEAFPFDPDPPAGALSSLDTFRRHESSVWFPGLQDMTVVEAYVRDLVIIQPDGGLKMRMSKGASDASLRSVTTYKRDYSQVHSPALAIYAESFLDLHHGPPSQQVAYSAWEQKYWSPFRAASMERIHRELAGVQVVSVPGTHMDYLFVSRDEVVAAMRRFLEESGS